MESNISLDSLFVRSYPVIFAADYPIKSVFVVMGTFYSNSRDGNVSNKYRVIKRSNFSGE